MINNDNETNHYFIYSSYEHILNVNVEHLWN